MSFLNKEQKTIYPDSKGLLTKVNATWDWLVNSFICHLNLLRKNRYIDWHVKRSERERERIREREREITWVRVIISPYSYLPRA